MLLLPPVARLARHCEIDFIGFPAGPEAQTGGSRPFEKTPRP
jgi:hypothetical protein